MRRFIICLIVLTIAVWIGVKIAADPGYVLLAYHNWTAEMPVWFALLVLIITFMLSYLIVRLLKNIGRLPRKIHNWTTRRRARINQRLTHQGLLALAFGKWLEAEKKLTKATPANALAWVNYLASARAAYERGDKDKCEYYLQSALNCTKEAEVAVGIEQYHFQYEQSQYEQALATLQKVHQLAPKQNYILRSLLLLCVKLADWQTVLSLLPAARQQHVLNMLELDAIEVKAQAAFLTRLAKPEIDLVTLENYWEHLPKQLRKNPSLLAHYTKALCQKNADLVAEKLLRQYLSKAWAAPLIYHYGLLNFPQPDAQLAQAEKWLATHDNDAILLLSLARICLRLQLWGKARSYFEASIASQPLPETYFELAKLLEKITDTQQACLVYKQGLALAAGQSVNLFSQLPSCS